MMMERPNVTGIFWAHFCLIFHPIRSPCSCVPRLWDANPS